jgi:hypothetical protein
MPDDQNQNQPPVTFTVTPQELQHLRGLAERELRENLQAQQHGADVSKFVEVGRREFGTDRFDAASQTVANALGGRKNETLSVLRTSNTPHRHIMALADDSDRLARFAQLPLESQRAEIALMENRTAPYGHARAFAEPAYKTPALAGGPVPDADWNAGACDLMNDKDAFAEIDRRIEERVKRRGGR